MTHFGHVLRTLGFLLLLTSGWGMDRPASGQSDSRALAERAAEGAADGVWEESPSLSEWAFEYLHSLEPYAEVASPSPGLNPGPEMERLRALYFLGIDNRGWHEKARTFLRALKAHFPPSSEGETLLRAYQGALQVVRAKHSRWPPNKLKHLNSGSEMLDSLVAAHPGNLEIRYLRYASYRFLPFFLRRDDSLASDLTVLAQELPHHPETFSPTVYRGVLRFILDHGEVSGEEVDRLQTILAAELRKEQEA
jgi:hypothetical protein